MSTQQTASNRDPRREQGRAFGSYDPRLDGPGRCGDRECEVCHEVRSADEFGNPHAQICERCYRLAGVDIWAASDGS